MKRTQEEKDAIYAENKGKFTCKSLIHETENGLEPVVLEIPYNELELHERIYESGFRTGRAFRLAMKGVQMKNWSDVNKLTVTENGSEFPQTWTK